MKINKFTSILFILVIIITWGCDQSGEQKTNVNEQIPQKEQLKSPNQQQTQTGEPDKYGRSTNDPHYGHNHSSGEHGHSNQKLDSIPKPASGEPDKYGRKPGDPHYGHNHQ